MTFSERLHRLRRDEREAEARAERAFARAFRGETKTFSAASRLRNEADEASYTLETDPEFSAHAYNPLSPDELREELDREEER